MKKKIIVTTTINPPTEAISLFDNLQDWTLLVVGDKKTPQDYKLNNGIYLSPDDQEKIAPELSGLIGWNCIQRRNLGFVHALDLGAEIIATVDDDNVPYDNWGENVFIGQSVDLISYCDEIGCFDPIGATGHKQLWHRGFPLQFLRFRNYSQYKHKKVKIEIQADFWDGDPDIDAVCRMEHAPNVQFEPEKFPFTSEAIAPFNSQNTFLSRDALAHYFMVPFVGRMDDIWGAYELQSRGYRPIFCAATVRQDRNAHDLTRDLENEYLGYSKNHEIIQSINNNTYKTADFWPERACLAFDAYRRRIGT